MFNRLFHLTTFAPAVLIILLGAPAPIQAQTAPSTVGIDPTIATTADYQKAAQCSSHSAVSRA